MAEQEVGGPEPPRNDDTLQEALAAKDLAEAQLIGAQKALAEAEARKMVAEGDARKLVAERDEAEMARRTAEKDLAKLQGEIVTGNRKLATDMNEQAERGLGVRQFVRQSLLDIMAGVDDAAAKGKIRAENDGMDGFLPSVTMIGATTDEGSVSERVEFDLAVTVAESASDATKEGGEVNAGLQVSLFGVAKFQVGASGQVERVTNEASSQGRSNRLKFAVPIVYAEQEASDD